MSGPSFDVIVVGGGHAGCEAAAAAARLGAAVALVTMDAKRIGAMSCNPAIGGLGKGHLVREIDAFDGLIARAADDAAIHYRMLNRSKGTAVHGPRVQADRKLFAASIQRQIAYYPNVTVIEGLANELVMTRGCAAGLTLSDGRVVRAGAVILATGTFLNARMYTGSSSVEGGRVGEPAATRLGTQLRAAGLPIGRLKTGTPPRLDGRTIDWSGLNRQDSDAEPWRMGLDRGERRLPQLFCAVTRTTSHTHRIIRDALPQSPLHSGAIEGRGPRYCPSIEDKVTRFGDRDGHQIFLEPEGLDDPLIYPNGISTSLPPDTQIQFVRSIAGLERAKIVTPGYAVEYDFIDPRALDPSLQVREIPGLFFAGQINGTTGYEEAAAQGLVAGLNAAAAASGLAPVLFDRSTSYIGVMIDDLTLQGVTEPYRMLTARAEYRLHLRANNALTRLGPQARQIGALRPARDRSLTLHLQELARGKELLQSRLSKSDLDADGSGPASREQRTVEEWLRSGNVTWSDLCRSHSPLNAISVEAAEELAEDVRYAPYIERLTREAERLSRDEAILIPEGLAFASIPGLSTEMAERLEAARPASVGQASRVRGITPAALTALVARVRRHAA